MKILITNDDGIDASGLRKLAEIVVKLSDEVYVVAPSGQRSAVSHSITVGKALRVRQVPFPVGVKAAYSCSGMPADCVKAAVHAILQERPDVVISGINKGYNMGYDTVYSGTVAAAREAVYQGIKGIAVSAGGDDYALADCWLERILRTLMDRKTASHEVWNINFPECGLEECVSETEWELLPVDEKFEPAGELTDFYATGHNFISVGKLECAVLRNC